MKIKFVDFKLKKDFDRILILHYAHFFIILFLILIEVLNGFNGLFYGLIKTTFILIIYKMYIKTMKNFYYTFWTFTFLISIYLVIGFWQGVFSFNYGPMGWLYFIAILCLIAECYLISSPLYYPRVSWWEYDFRYRDDLKIEIILNDKEFEGRLTDLRRNAGCVVLFENLKTGDFINFNVKEGNIGLVAEVVSKRYNTLGRGLIYGVKFHFNKPEDKNNFLTLCRFFEQKKRSAKKLKYHKIEAK